MRLLGWSPKSIRLVSSSESTGSLFPRAHTEGRPGEDARRNLSSAKQGERPHQQPPLTAPSSRTLSLPNWGNQFLLLQPPTPWCCVRASVVHRAGINASAHLLSPLTHLLSTLLSHFLPATWWPLVACTCNTPPQLSQGASPLLFQSFTQLSPHSGTFPDHLYLKL